MIKTFVILQVCLMALLFTNSTASAEEEDDFSRFTLGIKGGFSVLQDIDHFSATRFATVWTIKGNNTYVGAPFVRVALTDKILLEVEYAFEGSSDIDIRTQTISAEYHFNEVWDGYNPYIKAGALRGEISINSFPGNFDDGYGWLIGGGISQAYKRIVGFLEITYRGLGNEFNGNSITFASDDSIDLSGVSFKMGVGYKF